MANQDPDAPPASAALTQAELGDLCEVTTGELQADAARNRGVDAGTAIRRRRDAKDA